MKGRTVWNKLSIRKTDVYKLLVKLGGRARWSHLKARLKELGWGPTTLKRTLDDMVREGSVVKEAVAGDRGPEVWYKVKIVDSEEGKTFVEIFELERIEPSIQEMRRAIRVKVENLDKEARQIFLFSLFREFVGDLSELCKVAFCLGINELIHRPESADVAVDWVFEILKEKMKDSMYFVADYPDVGVQFVVSFLNEVSSKHTRKKDRRSLAERLENVGRS